MKKLLSALFFGLFALPGAASAQNVTFPLPSPADLQQWMQIATAAQQACPPVEISPGIFVPIPCMSALPAPPPNAPVVDAAPSAILPLSVDLRAMGRDGPVKDQAQAGVCFAFATTTVMENELRRQGRAEILSPLHFVAADAWEDLWRAKRGEAITREASWPYDPVKACRFKNDPDPWCERAYGVKSNTWQSDPRLSFEHASARASGVAFVGKGRSFKKGDLAGIMSALAQGRAVYASIGIDTAAWGFRGVRGGVLPDYVQADRGAHAVVLAGYRQSGFERQFLIHNSWGTRWGEGGYAWMSETSLRRHLRDAMLVDAVPTTGGVQPVPPVLPPPPPPQKSGLCPSGWPPLMGQCWLG